VGCAEADFHRVHAGLTYDLELTGDAHPQAEPKRSTFFA